MTLNELNILQKSHYYRDSDIFNLKSPKSPDKFKCKQITLNLDDNDNNNQNQANLSKDKYYLNKKDHINDCLRDKNWMSKYISRYEKYKTVENLRKESKKLQLDKSYDYNFGENNKMYKNIRLHHKKGNVSLGFENSISNFSSEYNSMQDFAKKMMLKKKLEKEKENMLNKSMDVPLKFKPLKRPNFNRKNYINELFTPNTIDIDLTRSTDSIRILKQKKNINNNTIDFYKSNIFFDKEKAKINDELNKYTEENKAKKKQEKLKIKRLQKEKSHPNIIRRKQNYFFEERPNKKPKNIEELKQFFRDGNFPLPYANYKPHKAVIISSIDDIYNSNNKKLYYGLTEMERNTDKFIVMGISKNNKFDPREIKNLFAKNGIHMFGEQTYSSFIENGKKGKFVFNIRRDVKDQEYPEKMKKIQDILFKKQGITFNIDNRKMNYNKKRRNDISPYIPTKKEDPII